jgi:hypothetical protein
MKINAWVYGTIRDLHTLTPEQLIDTVVLTNMEFGDRWTLVGHADVEVTLLPQDAMVASQVASLRKQIKEAQDQADRTISLCEDKIRSLQCLTMEVK